MVNDFAVNLDAENCSSNILVEYTMFFDFRKRNDKQSPFQQIRDTAQSISFKKVDSMQTDVRLNICR